MASVPFVWKIKTVWHPEVIGWMERHGSLWGRLLKHAENRCHLLCPKCRSTDREWDRGGGSSQWALYSWGWLQHLCKEAYSFQFRNWQKKKLERNWFIKSNKWPKGLKTFEIVCLQLKQLPEYIQLPFCHLQRMNASFMECYTADFRF